MTTIVLIEQTINQDPSNDNDPNGSTAAITRIAKSDTAKATHRIRFKFLIHTLYLANVFASTRMAFLGILILLLPYVKYQVTNTKTVLLCS